MPATDTQVESIAEHRRSQRKYDAARIRDLNDALRKKLQGGSFVVSAGVNALPSEIRDQALSRMQAYDNFCKANDPFQEHALGSFELDGQRFYWTIEAFDKNLRYGSVDPSDPEVTTRVLTLMLASEY